MTKAEIVDLIHEKIGGSKRECADMVEHLFEIIKESLEQGDKVKISGFGNFEVRQKKSRVGRNPYTGDAIEISARKVLTFKASQILKDAVQSGPGK
jgi:integration host factor subunit alpha